MPPWTIEINLTGSFFYPMFAEKLKVGFNPVRWSAPRETPENMKHQVPCPAFA